MFPTVPQRIYQREGSKFIGTVENADKPLSIPSRNKDRPPAVITHPAWREPPHRCRRPCAVTHTICRTCTPGLSKPRPGQQWRGQQAKWWREIETYYPGERLVWGSWLWVRADGWAGAEGWRSRKLVPPGCVLSISLAWIAPPFLQNRVDGADGPWSILQVSRLPITELCFCSCGSHATGHLEVGTGSWKEVAADGSGVPGDWEPRDSLPSQSWTQTEASLNKHPIESITKASPLVQAHKLTGWLWHRGCCFFISKTWIVRGFTEDKIVDTSGHCCNKNSTEYLVLKWSLALLSLQLSFLSYLTWESFTSILGV